MVNGLRVKLVTRFKQITQVTVIYGHYLCALILLQVIRSNMFSANVVEHWSCSSGSRGSQDTCQIIAKEQENCKQISRQARCGGALRCQQCYFSCCSSVSVSVKVLDHKFFQLLLSFSYFISVAIVIFQFQFQFQLYMYVT